MPYRPYLWLLVPLAVAALGSMALAGLSSETFGKIYGAVLQIQLTVDFLILLVALMLKLWPKGGAVAQAAFREAVRQPMYWLLFTIAFVLMWIFPFVPYFTFGEDYLMVKEMGYDTIMLVAAVFGTLAASLFISDEIEGRTAVTLMSKPVSRRQFLLGKFAGIMLAILLLFGLLGCCFQAVLLYKHWFEENFAFLDPMPFPPWVTSVLGKLSLAGPAMSFLRGVGFWADHAFETLPGLVLSLFLAMMVVALAVALATRLPMVVNVCVTLAVYLLANLSPVLVSIGEKAKLQKDAGAVADPVIHVAAVRYAAAGVALFPGRSGRGHRHAPADRTVLGLRRRRRAVWDHVHVHSAAARVDFVRGSRFGVKWTQA